MGFRKLDPIQGSGVGKFQDDNCAADLKSNQSRLGQEDRRLQEGDF